jgi:hypothetical protein
MSQRIDQKENKWDFILDFFLLSTIRGENKKTANSAAFNWIVFFRYFWLMIYLISFLE